MIMGRLKDNGDELDFMKDCNEKFKNKITNNNYIPN